MRVFHFALAAGLATSATLAGAQNGFVAPDESPWPRWQWRAQSLTATPSGAMSPDADTRGLQGMQLLGDYYVWDLRTADGRYAGALRATGGLTLGTAAGSRLLTSNWPAGVAGEGLSWRPTAPGATWGRDGGGLSALPYVGVGVTGLSVRGGWGVSADIGLAGYGSGSGLRMNPARSDSLAIDDVLRELRLAPVLQVGVSYSF